MPASEPKIFLGQEALSKTSSDLLLVPCYNQVKSKDKIDDLTQKTSQMLTETFSGLATIDVQLCQLMATILNEENFSTNSGLCLRYLHPKHKRIVFCGLGEVAKVTPQSVEMSVHKVLSEQVKLKKIKTALVLLPRWQPLEQQQSTQLNEYKQSSIILATLSAFFHFFYVSCESLEPGPIIEEIGIYLANEDSQKQDAAREVATAELEKLKDICFARALAMDLVNTPPNLQKASSLAQAALKLKKDSRLEVEVKDKLAWIEKQMPCFFTVAKGSLQSDPPCFIHLAYRREKIKPKLKIVLVGKSVIFDTGGYQLKPDEYMNTMKADMTGGASVLAVMQALAKLRPQNIEVHAMLAATPNMVNSHAFVPDSIISSTCGKKVEIRHTDAEGRLTLIDAVSMAHRQKPDLVITLATLTGAAARAVGPRSAIMANSCATAWQERYIGAAHLSGEAIQSLSVEQEDFDSIKSKLDSADIANDSHNKYRGAQTAAAFIFSGIPEDQPLIHLDIAGGDLSSDGKATGIAVRALLTFLLQEDDRLS